jgi:acid phosphatase
MSIKAFSVLFLSVSIVALHGCAMTGTAVSTPAHDNADAVLWLQSSTEYAAVTAGIYASAASSLRDLAPSLDTGRSAVVLDVDETVLDNSRYQGQLVFDNASYASDSWDRWVAMRAATGVPGAADFIRQSQALGFHVVFVTNRACRSRPDSTDACPQHEDTRRNLEAIGIDTSTTTLFLRGQRPPEACRPLLTSSEQAEGTWSSDKTSRRACVELDHDIVMLFGDQLGDFVEENDAARVPGRSATTPFDEKWGSAWFMLPNPTYGDWRPRTAAEKRAQIRGID